MVFRRSSNAGTPAQEDPHGSKKFHFSFGTHTRGELQQKIEDMLRQYQFSPLAGAEAVLSLFKDSKDIAILSDSPSVQYVMFGSGDHAGPITYFLQKAVQQQEATGSVDVKTQERFEAAKKQYEKLHGHAETARIIREDPKGTKIYDFSFGSMTGSQLQQKMEDTMSQHAQIWLYIEGAERLLDMFSRPQDAAILRDSPNIQHRVLGGVNGQGPIDFMLDKADTQISAGQSGALPRAVNPAALRLEQLEARYERIRNEALGRTNRTGRATTSENQQPRVYNADDFRSPGAPQRY